MADIITEKHTQSIWCCCHGDSFIAQIKYDSPELPTPPHQSCGSCYNAFLWKRGLCNPMHEEYVSLILDHKCAAACVFVDYNFYTLIGFRLNLECEFDTKTCPSSLRLVHVCRV